MHFNEDGPFQISRDEILQLIGCAFTKTLQRDAVLFGMENQVQERCLMHRFACELRALLKFAEDFQCEGQPVMSLDVEYNRAGEELKTPKGVEQDWIAVDILFHERKSAEKDCRNDILCCEMKKTGEEQGADRWKVLCIMRQYKYRFGIDFFHLWFMFLYTIDRLATWFGFICYFCWNGSFIRISNKGRSRCSNRNF